MTHLCLGTANKPKQVIFTWRNSEAGVTGKHQAAAVSFSKQELKPISITQILLFIKYEEKRWLKYRLHCATVLGEWKDKIWENTNFSSRKEETWFRSELLFHCTPLLTLRILQIYFSIMRNNRYNTVNQRNERPISPFYRFLLECHVYPGSTKTIKHKVTTHNQSQFHSNFCSSHNPC